MTMMIAAKEPLVIYCGVTMGSVIKKIAKLYTEIYHQEVRIIQGASSRLLEEITHSKVGDLYLPGNARYITDYPDASFFPYRRVIGSMQMVCFTRPGNPYRVHTLQDLTRPDLRVAIGAPSVGSIGKTTRELIEQNFDAKLYRRIALNALYFAIDSRDMNRLYDLGLIDTGITWKPAIFGKLRYQTLSIIPLRHDHKLKAQQPIMITTLAHSHQQESAKKMIEMIRSSEGKKILESEGFDAQ
jgi:molybdate transport system substrate-binding protein